MVVPEKHDDGEELSLLQQPNNADSSWRLNFDGFQLSSEHKEKPPRGLHDCYGVLGSFVFIISS